MSDLLIRGPEEKKREITSYLKRNKIEYTKVQSSKKKKMVDLKRLSGIVSVGEMRLKTQRNSIQRIVHDSSFLMGLIDEKKDSWHGRSVETVDHLNSLEHEDIICDCVMDEVVSVWPGDLKR